MQRDISSKDPDELMCMATSKLHACLTKRQEISSGEFG
jgi:hypothetical protein